MDGRRQQDVVDEAHDEGEAAVAAVFGQLGAGQHAERRADHERQTDIIRLPTMALAGRPSLPGGGVISVNTPRSMPAMPLPTSVHRIETRKTRPNSGAASARADDHGDVAAASGRRRVASGLAWGLMSPALRSSAQQHVAGERQHDEGDDEQHEAQQRAGASDEAPVASPKSLAITAAMVVPGSSKRGRHADGVADDEGHRHGLAERAAQAQQDAADHADRGCRAGRCPSIDFPAGAAQRVGRFLQQRRHGQEHVARHRGDEGQDHDRQDEAGGQHADAERRAREEQPNSGDGAEHALISPAGRVRSSAARARTGPTCRR